MELRNKIDKKKQKKNTHSTLTHNDWFDYGAHSWRVGNFL